MNRWLIYGVILTYMFSVVGCVDQKRTSDSSVVKIETAEVSEKVEIRIATMFGGIDPARHVFEQQLLDFMEIYPDVTIINESMTSIGDEYRTVIKTNYSTGNEADAVFFYNGVDADGIINAKAVMPYDEIWLDYPEVGKDITKAVKTFMREEDGHLYCLPLTGFYEGLFVNTEIFEEYGIELPTNWDNLTKAIEVLKENGVVPIAAPLSQSLYLIEHFILAESGIEIYQNELEDEVPSNWVKGLERIKAFREMGAFSENAITMDVEDSQNQFTHEKAAMIFEGSWFVGRCSEELRAKMTVLPMPPTPGSVKDPTSVIAGYSSGYYISRSAYENMSKQKTVIDLVSFLTTKEAIKAMAAANGGTPSAVVVPDGLEPIVIDGQAMVANASAIALPIDSRLKPEAFSYIVREGIPFIVYGEREVLDVLEEAKRLNNQ